MTTQKLLWRVHHWAGFYAGVFIIVLSVSGALAVYLPEIDYGSNRDLFTVPVGESTQPLNAVVASAVEEYGATSPSNYLSYVRLPEGPGQTIICRFITDAPELSGVQRQFQYRFDDVFVDPYTLAITGTRDYLKSFAYYLRQFHVRLLDGIWGRQIVGLFGAALFVSVVTGLLIYGNFMRKRRFGQLQTRNARTLSADLHKYIGVTALVFNIVIAATGAWLGLQPVFLQMGVVEVPNRAYDAEEKLTAETDVAYPVDYDGVLAKTGQVFPDMVPKRIHPSHDGTRKVEVYGDVPGMIYERNIQKVVLDKETHEVLFVYDARKGGAVDMLYYIQEALHFGDYGGQPVKLLYCLLGVTSGGLAMSGLVITLWRRSGPNKVRGVMYPMVIWTAVLLGPIAGMWMISASLGGVVAMAVFSMTLYFLVLPSIGLYWFARFAFWRVERRRSA